MGEFLGGDGVARGGFAWKYSGRGLRSACMSGREMRAFAGLRGAKLRPAAVLFGTAKFKIKWVC